MLIVCGESSSLFGIRSCKSHLNIFFNVRLLLSYITSFILLFVSSNKNAFPFLCHASVISLHSSPDPCAHPSPLFNSRCSPDEAQAPVTYRPSLFLRWQRSRWQMLVFDLYHSIGTLWHSPFGLELGQRNKLWSLCKRQGTRREQHQCYGISPFLC